jgi:hypothetical protein
MSIGTWPLRVDIHTLLELLIIKFLKIIAKNRRVQFFLFFDIL